MRVRLPNTSIERFGQQISEDINHGRLYPNLDRMVDARLISKQTKESDKRRKEYALTGRGEWVAEEYPRFVQGMIAPGDE